MATEKRLIDANALLVDLKDELGFETPMFTAEQNKWIDYGLKVAIKDVKFQPTIDAVEVVHGRWISEVVRKPDWKGKMRYYYQASSCSVCHKPDPGYGTSNYCPNCGAKMYGDGNG